jgi:hypothetical protein
MKRLRLGIDVEGDLRNDYDWDELPENESPPVPDEDKKQRPRSNTSKSGAKPYKRRGMTPKQRRARWSK